VSSHPLQKKESLLDKQEREGGTQSRKKIRERKPIALNRRRPLWGESNVEGGSSTYCVSGKSKESKLPKGTDGGETRFTEDRSSRRLLSGYKKRKK